MERAYARSHPGSDRARELIEQEEELVGALCGPGGLSQRKALEAIGLSRSTWHYRHHPRPRVPDPLRQAQRVQPGALSATEVAVISDHVQAGWAGGNSVDHAFAAAWDQGVVVGSRRSWWRVAGRIDQQHRPARPARSGSAARGRPQLLATGPNQVWSWDITDFKGPWRGCTYKVYSIIDIYSRKIIAAQVHPREADRWAEQLFRDAFAAEATTPQWVHADCGAAMRSEVMARLLAEHGITESHSRPRVSNDNPYKESEFRTLKQRQHFPGVFDSIEEAADYVDSYVRWYNHDHRHTGLGLYTPVQVHDGTWTTVHDRRQQTLEAYYQAHPGRFRRRPITATPPAWSGINHPGPEDPPEKSAN